MLDPFSTSSERCFYLHFSSPVTTCRHCIKFSPTHLTSSTLCQQNQQPGSGLESRAHMCSSCGFLLSVWAATASSWTVPPGKTCGGRCRATSPSPGSPRSVSSLGRFRSVTARASRIIACLHVVSAVKSVAVDPLHRSISVATIVCNVWIQSLPCLYLEAAGYTSLLAYWRGFTAVFRNGS